MTDTRTAPIRIHVTEAPGHRQRPAETGDVLMDALASHIQRIACEGARAAYCLSPATQQWLERDTSSIGWRAQIQRDTAHLIHVLEAQGIMEFDDA